MDLYQVMVGLSKNPENYLEEYRQQLRSFEALVRLPKQPEKIIRQTLSFLLAHPKVDGKLPEILIGSIGNIRCHKIRRIVIESLFILRHKNLISTGQLFKNLLGHCTDLKSVLNKARKWADEDAIPHIQNYYRKGTEKQRCFCYYIIVHLFAKGYSQLEDEVCEGLFADGKVGKICMLYLLDQIEFESDDVREKAMSLLSDNAEKFGKLLFKEISEDRMERDTKIMKMKIYVLFKVRYNLRGSVVAIAMNMLNPDKEDVKELIRIIVDSAMDGDVLKVIDVIREGFCSEFRDDDFIVYGLNILRELYCKFDPEVFKPKDSVDEHENAISEESVKDDLETEDVTEERQALLEKIRDRIFNCIECFRGSKVKSIYYAHASVVNAMKHKRYLDRAPEYVRRKATKEEKAISRKTSKKEKKYSGGKHAKRRKIGRRKASKMG